MPLPLSLSSHLSNTFHSRLSPKLFAYLQLVRPANVVTAWADILAGYGAASTITAGDSQALLWLLLATSGLYAGGITFNDILDAELDAIERPERPIPSQRAAYPVAIVLGTTLLLIGILAAAQVSFLSGSLASVIALLALLYNKSSKHSSLWGPINMGLCRGGNLLLGISAAGTIQPLWFLLFIPLVYISAVTVMSQQEVSGGNRTKGVTALCLLGLSFCLLAALLQLAVVQWSLLPIVLLLALLTLFPFVRVLQSPDALTVRTAVKAGVISLIVLDSAIATGFAGEFYGLCVLALLPLSMGLSRLFAVT